MLVENLAMQYLTGQLVVSYGTINRFRVAEGMEELIRNLFIDINLRLKMEELVTLDCLFIDGTKIEANANKYSFVWKKATDKFSVKLQEQLQIYFQEEITPLIHQAIELDTQEPISSEQWLAFAQILEEELEKLNQDIEETPVKGKEERKTQRCKLKKVLHKVKEDFSVRTEKYESYQDLKAKECQALLSPEGRQIFAQRKVDVEPVFGQIKACLGYKRCNLRGKRQVRIDMGLVLMANNLLKNPTNRLISWVFIYEIEFLCLIFND